MKTFPKDFIWGAAAASYQIEGAAYEDGKGLSVWDRMCRYEGTIHSNDTGDVACDHYHRWKEDVDLMASLKLQAYRLSLSWPRILPQGTGKINDAGLDFYDKLIDRLLAKGIEPWVTLFHWDFPYTLYQKGGWLNPQSPIWFEEYATIVAKKLGDRVKNWMTLNEPQVFLGLGHQIGIHAPGLKLDFSEVLLAWHHVLQAHGRSVIALRENCQNPIRIGAAPVSGIGIPASESKEDIEAARKFTWTFKDQNIWNHSWYGDPVLKGHYPEAGLEAFAKYLPPMKDEDFAIMKQPVDFYGFNCYNGTVVQAADNETGFTECPYPVGGKRTSFDWTVTPDALRWGPRFLHERYGLPLVVTENGLANNDWVATDGKVHDPQRIDFLRRHLRSFHQAIEDGVPCLGYFQWSIMDNFEWAEGYRKRFGLVYIDYETQERIPKQSAHWYRKVIESQGGEVFSDTL
ncbi:MAG: beta-glucosidase [Opitutales bacterium]|nr:beta-glucosidase [Opitutales bacterium]